MGNRHRLGMMVGSVISAMMRSVPPQSGQMVMRLPLDI